jgi:hypothetical protein
MNSRKITVICAGLAVIVVIAAASITSRKPASTSSVKDVSTTATSQHHDNKLDNSPDDTTEVLNATTPTPNNSKPKKPSSVPVTASTQSPTPTTQPAPTPTPTPQPTPSFTIVLRDNEAYVQTYPPEMGIEQLIVPFDVVHDAGFVPSNFAQPHCQFLVTPNPDHGVLCNVTEKDRGYLGMQYTESSAPGHYKVQVNYTINGVVRTDTTEFDLD